MNIERLRIVRQGRADALQFIKLHRSVAAPVVVDRRHEARPLTVEPVGLVRLERLCGGKLLVEKRAELRLLAVGVGGAEHAFLDQPFGIDLARRLERADLFVHFRLGEARLVAFVVAEAAIAKHVDDDVGAELLAELGRDFRRVDHRFRIVAVDVKDRRFDHFRHVRRIGR